jgi:hypothetical protein
VVTEIANEWEKLIEGWPIKDPKDSSPNHFYYSNRRFDLSWKLNEDLISKTLNQTIQPIKLKMKVT